MRSLLQGLQLPEPHVTLMWRLQAAIDNPANQHTPSSPRVSLSRGYSQAGESQKPRASNKSSPNNLQPWIVHAPTNKLKPPTSNLLHALLSGSAEKRQLLAPLFNRCTCASRHKIMVCQKLYCSYSLGGPTRWIWGYNIMHGS